MNWYKAAMPRFDNLKNIQPFPGSLVQHLVFHGTNQKFNAFEAGRKSKRYYGLLGPTHEYEVSTQGIFFSPSYGGAKRYGDNIIAAYINLQNPVTTGQGYVSEDEEKFAKVRELFLPYVEGEKGRRVFEVGVYTVDFDDRDGNEEPFWVDKLTNSGMDWACLDYPGLGARMKALGFDGTVVSEPEDPHNISYMVLGDEQVRWVPAPKPTPQQASDWKLENPEDYEGEEGYPDDQLYPYVD
jgi:hypothetical protein